MFSPLVGTKHDWIVRAREREKHNITINPNWFPIVIIIVDYAR